MFLDATSEMCDAIKEGNEDQFNYSLMLFLVYSGLAGLTAVGNQTSFGIGGMRLVKRLRMDLLASLMRQELAFFDVLSPGALISHLNSDTVCPQSPLNVTTHIAGQAWRIEGNLAMGGEPHPSSRSRCFPTHESQLEAVVGSFRHVGRSSHVDPLPRQKHYCALCQGLFQTSP